MSKPSISLALIVRNASATLEKCLSTFKEVADEIVIVDTGSTDNTIEIARKYTNNIFFFEWIDDFSAARNFCFDKCTKDWILWVDADDYILPADIKKIKELDFSDKEIIICNYEYAHDEFGNSTCTVPRERIIKRSLGLKWQDPIHEYLPLNGKVYISDITTHHNKQHGTSERNLALLERLIERDASPRNIYYLGKEYFEVGRYDDAIKYLEIFVRRPDGFWEDKYKAYYKLAICYLNKGNEEAFKNNVFKSIAIEERWAEPYCLLGLYYLNKQQWDKSIFWYETALNVKRPKGLLAYYQAEYYTWLPALNLCLAYNAIGDIKKAYEYNKKVLQYRPQDPRALNNDKILSEAIKREEEKASESSSKIDGLGKKLNLGCGNKRYQDYVGVDIFKGAAVDEVFSLDDIPYADGTIGAIYSEHALEHIPFKRVEKALDEWFRILKPGGELILKIPDFHECCRNYVEALGNKYSRWWFKATIYGIQESQAGEPDEFQIHMSGFSQEEIKEVLERHGFIVKSINKYNGFNTPSLEVHALKRVSDIKIGWIAPVNWEAAQTRIRVLRVNEWLRKNGYQSQIVDNYNDAINYNFNTVIVGKSFSEADLNGIRMLKQKGIKVYGDICESLFEFPYFKEILSECDKVICCSDILAEQCRTVNNNVLVIEDAYE